jgi:retinol-binding protein 3
LQAQKLIIDKAVAKATNPDEKTPLEWRQLALNAELSPVSLSEKVKQTYAGVYGNKTILLQEGQLYLQKEGGEKVKLVPLAENLFQPEGTDNFRIQFQKDQQGNVEKLLGMYEWGETEETQRTAKTF